MRAKLSHNELLSGTPSLPFLYIRDITSVANKKPKVKVTPDLRG